MIKFDDIILFLDTQQDPLIAQSRRGPKCKVYIKKKKVCKRIQIKQRNYLPYEKNGLSLIFKTLIGKYRNWHERLSNFVLHFFFYTHAVYVFMSVHQVIYIFLDVSEHLFMYNC